MPAMIVWPVSSLVKTRKVGSSSESRWSAIAHLFLVVLGLRLDRHRDDRIRERRRLEQDRKILIAKRVARGDVLDADDRGDVTGVTGVDVFALVGLNLNQAADALALVRARIVNRVALGELAGIDAEENELADERIAPELERERAELAVVVRRRFHRLVGIRVHAHRRAECRAGPGDNR